LASIGQNGERISVMRNRSAPSAPLVPMLVYDDVNSVIDWLCDSCGFKERVRVQRPDGRVTHAQLEFAGGAVMLGSAGADYRPPRSSEVSHGVLVHVDDVNAHFDRVRNSGARIVTEPADMPFGERQYTVEDSGGHRWTFSESIADVPPEEWGGRTR
jgi:uncharacterized glyoxalase superfamily protein PhnB